jgi:hypothetical protein
MSALRVRLVLFFRCLTRALLALARSSELPSMRLAQPVIVVL